MVIFILTLTASTQAFELYFIAKNEPFNAETFRKTNGGWTFIDEYLSLGLELSTHYEDQYFYTLIRVIPYESLGEFFVTGGIFKAGIEIGDRNLCFEYTTNIYWSEVVGLYTEPAHKFTVNVRIPIL